MTFYANLLNNSKKLSISFSSIFGIDFFVKLSPFNFLKDIWFNDAGPCWPQLWSERKRLWCIGVTFREPMPDLFLRPQFPLNAIHPFAFFCKPEFLRALTQSWKSNKICYYYVIEFWVIDFDSDLVTNQQIFNAYMDELERMLVFPFR